MRRFWSFGHQVYAAGALDVKTKELMGLVASMVWRSDDCIKYHLGILKDAGITTEQFYEAFTIATWVGSSMVIPHMRRAAEYWEQLNSNI